MTFGERLVFARELRGLSQKKFAELIEVTPTRLNYWEKDKREPDVLMIWKIISALNISGNWLIGEDGEIENHNNTTQDNNDWRKQKIMRNYNAMNDSGRDRLAYYSDDLIGNLKYVAAEIKK